MSKNCKSTFGVYLITKPNFCGVNACGIKNVAVVRRPLREIHRNTEDVLCHPQIWLESFRLYQAK